MNRSFFLRAIILFGIGTAPCFAANTLSTGGHDGTVRSQSADMLGAGTVNLGGALHYGQEWEYLHSLSPSFDRTGSPVIFSGVGYFAIGALPNLEFGVNLPAYYDVPRFGSQNAGGIGDLELSAKLSGFYFAGDEKVFTGAYYLSAQFPTGSKADGFFPEHAYYGSDGNWSSGKIILVPMLVSTLHFDRLKTPAPLRLNLNFGGAFNAPDDNNALTASAALEFLMNDFWTLFAEISSEERFVTVHAKTFFRDLVNDPIYITPGFKVTIPQTNLTLTFAADLGVSEKNRDYAQTSMSETGVTISHQANPLYNVYFGLGWLIPGAPKDDDGDGIVGKSDLCPDKAEDKDGFKDDDGCPDPDNDNDGIADLLDKCPNDSGIGKFQGCPDSDNDGIVDGIDKCPKAAGIPENNGCPDVDGDKDGIADRLDKCPKDAGIAENNGCPDVDGDKDGVADRLDKCVSDPEDMDAFRDDDGCPDPGNDGDGFPDLTDKCPNNPGVAETGGCPKTKEITRGQLILKGVNFESSKAVLLGGSYQVLDEIVQSLKEWPEVRIEIQGHTDNSGVPAKNLELSQQRAETVRQYMIDKGIAADRLKAVGYGQEKPVADNKTSNGRAQNRRVELNRLD